MTTGLNLRLCFRLFLYALVVITTLALDVGFGYDRHHNSRVCDSIEVVTAYDAVSVLPTDEKRTVVAGAGVPFAECAGFVAAEETAALRSYGGPGGGHHLPAKSAFEGAAGYDLNQALAIPNAELARLGVNHGLVSGAQQTLYRAFAQTGAPLTWEAAARIETQALVRGGMNPGMAQTTAAKAIEALKGAGVSGPTRIPWGK